MKHNTIEFFHLLGNEKLNKDHYKSYEIYLKIKNDGFKGVILIDNYNYSLDEDFCLPIELQDSVEVYYEECFKKYVKYILNLLNLKDEDDIKFKNIFLKKNGKYTCSCLTTCWYLYRLGFFSNYNNKIINILPKKYRNVEKNTIKIIKKIDKNLYKNIKTIFIGDEDEVYSK